MTKEIVAALLIVLLFAAALFNIASLDNRIGMILEDAAAARKYAESGDFAAAQKALDTALEHWIAANAYTHIFIRHPEIDSTSDAFFELRQTLAEEKADGFPSAFDKLIYHLNSIDEMEHIRFGSVM